MASAAAGARAAESKTSYYLDKLQSLSGIIPIGAFLVEHFWSNSYALVSRRSYDDVSLDLQIIPWRLAVEICVLWAPIAFHGLYGLWIWWKGKQNTFGHPWMSNWMYLLQRWSGIVAFVFIGWHVYTARFLSHGRTNYDEMAQAMSHPWYFAFYIVGVTAASFHLGNGLWNFACKWGLAVSARAQRAVGWFGAAVAVVFTFVGILIAVGFYNSWFPLGGYVH
jgi:succinate dehydrogenase / fumarate reductase, cytochrome b subunit